MVKPYISILKDYWKLKYFYIIFQTLSVVIITLYDTEALKFSNLIRVKHSGTRNLNLFLVPPSLFFFILYDTVQISSSGEQVNFPWCIPLVPCTAINFHTLRLFLCFGDQKVEVELPMFCFGIFLNWAKSMSYQVMGFH